MPKPTNRELYAQLQLAERSVAEKAVKMVEERAAQDRAYQAELAALIDELGAPVTSTIPLAQALYGHAEAARLTVENAAVNVRRYQQILTDYPVPDVDEATDAEAAG